LRQENCNFHDSLGYIVKPCQKKTKRRETISYKQKCPFFKNRGQEDKTVPVLGLVPVGGGGYKEKV
jgi:1-aminocyclopropane-1-carboxylate deaminase/D-cysteine desulfhydrase-like pyridoxal-dependent ACC family enzyme